MYHSIEISGVTSGSQLPENLSEILYLEHGETDTLCLPCQKPSIDTLLQLFVSTALCGIKPLCTPTGRKRLVHMVKQFKIMYVAAEPLQTVHSAYFQRHFSCCLPFATTAIELAVADLSVLSVDCRSFTLSTLLLVYPNLEKKIKLDPAPLQHVTHFNCSQMPYQPADSYSRPCRKGGHP